MTQQIKQDKADGTTVAQGSLGARPSFSRKPSTSANDNNCEGTWPLIPFPEGLNYIPSGQQGLSERLSTESGRPSFLYEEATAPQAFQTSFRSSWKGTLGKVTYAVGVSIAMLGWLYLIWLVLVSIMQWLLS